MIMESPNLVSASDLRRLTFGSYEQKIAQLRESILTGTAEISGVRVESLDLLATFEKRAVVSGPDNKFFAVTLETADDGDVHVVACAPEKVDVIDSTRMGAFIEAEVGAAVDAWFKGDVSAAVARISSVMPYVASTTEGDEKQALASLASHTEAVYRPWRRMFESRKTHIHRFVVNHFARLESTKLAAKYRKLYDGSLAESTLDGYESIVENDLAIVQNRYKLLAAETSAAVDRAAGPLEKAKGTSNDTIQLYSGFAEDLILDLAGVERLAERVSTRVSSISGRGRLRDLLAEALHQYEVASRFVVEVAERLSQAA